MAATSATTSTPQRKATKRLLKPKLPQTLHELVSKGATKQEQQQLTVTHISKQGQQIVNGETMLLNKNIRSDVTYNANAMGPGNVLRIRTPAPHDVLSGRGGSVNAHPGNCQFRDWVHAHKEEYNLARSKQAKADLCRMIIGKVTSLGGRFLTKENPNAQWWVEQDDERMMSKTSQALREGAPKIREAHRDELGTSGNKSRRKSHSTISINNKLTSEAINSNGKRVRVDYKGQTVFTNQSTPPLRSTKEPSTVPSNTDVVPDFQLAPPAASSTPSIRQPFRFPPPLRSTATTNRGYSRSNSLATSDIVIFDDNCEFVNPFEDESHLFDTSMPNSNQPMDDSTVTEPHKVSNERNLSDSTGNSSVLGIKPGLRRESSVSSTITDFAGYGALLRGINDNNNNSNCYNDSLRSMNSMGNISLASKTTAHIVPMRSTSIGSVSTADKDTITETSHFYQHHDRNDCDDNDDNRSVASEATIGLPLWDWFNRDDATKDPSVVGVDTVPTSSAGSTPHEIPLNHHPIPIV